MSAFLLCLCCSVCRAALKNPDPPSKQFYRLSVKCIFLEVILNGNRTESLIRESGIRIIIII
jgi:hypothetical protein